MIRVIALMALLIFPLQAAQATEVGSRPFGLGIVLGDPTGLSGKYYLGGKINAIDMAIGGDTYGRNRGGLYLHATYLWHPSILADPGPFEMPWHIGVGGFLGGGTWDRGRRNDAFIGARAPIGLDLDFHDAPVQVFGDIALHLLIVPDVFIDLDVSIGVRYFF